MRRIANLIALVSLAALAAAPLHAKVIVRDEALIATMPIEGVTLSMTPEEAFNRLKSRGYTSQGIPTYDAWTTGGISMVWGTYGGPEGYSEITISRTKSNDRIIEITETFNRPRQPFDVGAEIGAMQNHFSIPSDDPDCHVARGGAGACRVADAEEDENHVYGLTAMPAMIQRYASRKKEYLDSY